ncbi:MAG: FHA domain-containing protein [Myxococcota bacterium]
MAAELRFVIEDDTGARNIVPVALGEVSIGRLEGNTIRLNERNVSRRHARIFRDGELFFAEDLNSYNGLYINGDRVTGRNDVYGGDVIQIGDFQIELQGDALKARPEDTDQLSAVSGFERTQPEIHLSGDLAASDQTDDDSEGAEVEPTAIIRFDPTPDPNASHPTVRTDVELGKRPRLLCVSSPLAGQEFEIVSSEVVIGRTSENDVQIDHRSVSRHHAKIIYANNKYKIIDQNSANGTLVNSEQYAQLALMPGDLIELGHVRFRFLPPGFNYTPSSEELQAIEQAHASGNFVSSIRTSSVAEALQGAVKANPLGAVAVLGLLMAAFILVAWIIFSGGKNIQSSEDSVAARVADEGTVDVEGLIEQAKTFMASNQWSSAMTRLNLAQERQPNHPEAMSLLKSARSERRSQEGINVAKTAVSVEDWAGAWRALRDIPRTSVYFSEVESMRQQIQPGLVRLWLADARGAIKDQDWLTAGDIAEEMTELDLERATELKGELEAAKKARQSANRSQARAKAPERAASRSSRGALDSPKAAPAPTPVTEAKALSTVTKDAKAYYSEGVGLLRANNINAAIDRFNRCMQMDRRACHCYRAAGIAYAKGNDAKKATRFYKLYLKCAPNAKDADQVREILKGETP